MSVWICYPLALCDSSLWLECYGKLNWSLVCGIVSPIWSTSQFKLVKFAMCVIHMTYPKPLAQCLRFISEYLDPINAVLKMTKMHEKLSESKHSTVCNIKIGLHHISTKLSPKYFCPFLHYQKAECPHIID